MMKIHTDLHEFIQTLLALKNEHDAVDFLEGILTPKELLDIPQRLQIVKMLKAGISQREIANKLGVGIATVTRGSREIQRGKFSQVK